MTYRNFKSSGCGMLNKKPNIEIKREPSPKPPLAKHSSFITQLV